MHRAHLNLSLAKHEGFMSCIDATLLLATSSIGPVAKSMTTIGQRPCFTCLRLTFVSSIETSACSKKLKNTTTTSTSQYNINNSATLRWNCFAACCCWCCRRNF